MANLINAEHFILKKLDTELPDGLFYHGIHHTLNVAATAKFIALQEGVTNPADLNLLYFAALYHDAGFIVSYQNHEENSCLLARENLPQFGFSTEDLDVICALIMATKVPQNAQTHLERILCDADLDYLGRDNISSIAGMLYKELHTQGFVKDVEAWNEIQIKFLTQHTFHTEYAQKKLNPKKMAYLDELKKLSK